MATYSLRLRPARPEDERLFLEWGKDPVTRAAITKSPDLTEDEHRAWLRQILEDPETLLLVVEESWRPIGQVRLSRLEPELAEITIALAPGARGRGVGRRAVEIATTQAGDKLGVQAVKALIKEDNEVALAVFRAAGYEDFGRNGDSIELRRS